MLAAMLDPSPLNSSMSSDKSIRDTDLDEVRLAEVTERGREKAKKRSSSMGLELDLTAVLKR
jgi:hypothetical protein